MKKTQDLGSNVSAATEQDVCETIEADEDVDRNGAIPHRKVMARARATIERHAAKRRPKAA